jgi:hypothetical protein
VFDLSEVSSDLVDFKFATEEHIHEALETVHDHFPQRIDGNKIKKIGQPQKPHKLAPNRTSVSKADIAGEAQINKSLNLLIQHRILLIFVLLIIELLPSKYLTLQLLHNNLQPFSTISMHFLRTFFQVVNQ